MFEVAKSYKGIIIVPEISTQNNGNFFSAERGEGRERVPLFVAIEHDPGEVRKLREDDRTHARCQRDGNCKVNSCIILVYLPTKEEDVSLSMFDLLLTIV